MSGPFDKYVEQATQALRDNHFVDLDDDTIATYPMNDPVPLWVSAEHAARAVLAAVGPLIQEDTRDRMVTAAAASLGRDGGGEQHIPDVELGFDPHPVELCEPARCRPTEPRGTA